MREKAEADKTLAVGLGMGLRMGLGMGKDMVIRAFKCNDTV